MSRHEEARAVILGIAGGIIGLLTCVGAISLLRGL